MGWPQCRGQPSKPNSRLVSYANKNRLPRPMKLRLPFGGVVGGSGKWSQRLLRSSAGGPDRNVRPVERTRPTAETSATTIATGVAFRRAACGAEWAAGNCLRALHMDAVVEHGMPRVANRRHSTIYATGLVDLTSTPWAQALS